MTGFRINSSICISSDGLVYKWVDACDTLRRSLLNASTIGMPTMDYEAVVERILAYVESALHIHQDNKRHIVNYHREMVLADISAAQQQKVLVHLKIIIDHLAQTSCESLDRAEMEDLVAWLYTRGTNDSTPTRTGSMPSSRTSPTLKAPKAPRVG